MWKIIHKIKENDVFNIKTLENTFNFKKMATSAMMTYGKEKIKKTCLKYKNKLNKKEAIILLYDKKTDSLAIVKTLRKKPIEVLEVWELKEVVS